MIYTVFVVIKTCNWGNRIDIDFLSVNSFD